MRFISASGILFESMRQQYFVLHQSLAVLSFFISLMRPALGHEVSAECFQYNLNVHLGDKAPQEEITSLEIYDPHADYRRLASGIGGGKVYRVYPADGKPTYILKQYHLPEQRDSDDMAFKMLQSWMPPLEGIKIVRPKALGKRSMKLPSIKGETLDTALLNPKLSEAEKDRLLKAWNHFIAVANDALPKNPSVYYHEIFNRNLVHTFNLRFRKNGESYPIWLKPDNVIVQTKTGKMFLIDPY